MRLDRLRDVLKAREISFRTGEPMKCHTGFKTGGAADVFVRPDSAEQLKTALKACAEYGVPCFILGNGTNLLVCDEGIRGAVISTCGINKITVDGETVKAGAGASLSAVCTAARDNGLAGLEFAYGIPGTAGGALYMNAGAYGGETADVAKSAEYVTENGEIGTLDVSEMGLCYRGSVFKKGGKIITSVTFALKKGDRREITEKMQEIMGRRRDKQPLEYPSAGSTFKRPEGFFAGALIEKNGLKGLTVGGAQVSEKHAGFIINRGGASSRDITELISRVRNAVREGDGVTLEPEVIFVDENGENKWNF